MWVTVIVLPPVQDEDASRCRALDPNQSWSEGIDPGPLLFGAPPAVKPCPERATKEVLLVGWRGQVWGWDALTCDRHLDETVDRFRHYRRGRPLKVKRVRPAAQGAVPGPGST